MDGTTLNPPSLFWIRAEIRDCYPQDKAERVTEPSAARLHEKERLLNRIAREIAVAASRGKTPELLAPLRIQKVDASTECDKAQFAVFDPKGDTPAISLFQSDDLYMLALVSVAHIKGKYHESVWAITEHLIEREEIRIDELSAEEAYVFQKKRGYIEQARASLTQVSSHQSV